MAAPPPLPLAVTMGEPAGLGGEIAVQAWLRRSEGVPPFYLIDDPERLSRLARRCGWTVPIRRLGAPGEAAGAFAAALPVLPIGATPGAAAALVTNPINKDALYRVGFRHPGHTEYLAELAGGGATPVMMLASAALRVVPVTIHLSLRRAIETLSGDAIVHAGVVADAALRRDFAIAAPVIAVAGLNPHAGEGGSLGREDIDIVVPAVAELRRRGVDARGPFAADTMFHARARAGYDAALCMYHDQALIPLKTLDFDGGVNATLGLPFIRTSPDHGTAFDIAGRGIARPDSLMAALRLAAEMARRRAAR